MRNSNEIFRKSVTYDDIKIHKKLESHPLFRRYIFQKTTEEKEGGSNWLPPPFSSSFNVKILGVHFGNYVLDNSSWDEISHSLIKKSIYWTECNSPWKKEKRILNQILLSKLWYTGQIYTIPKVIKREIKKRIAQLSIWN